jgi:hypothetical protein
LVPALAAYGAVTVGGPLAWLWHAKRRWAELTVRLNERFWQHAADEPDVFVRRAMGDGGGPPGAGGWEAGESSGGEAGAASKSFDEGRTSRPGFSDPPSPLRARSSSL